MSIAIIAAMDKNGAIGKDGKLPWNIPSEMKHFRETTAGHTVIMGWNTFDSLNLKPLEGRRNIVAVKKPTMRNYKHQHDLMGLHDNLDFRWDFTTILHGKPNRCITGDCFIIGGEQTYKNLMKYADKMILSIIDIEVEGADKFFPPWNKEEWQLTDEKPVKNEDEPAYRIQTWERKK